MAEMLKPDDVQLTEDEWARVYRIAGWYDAMAERIGNDVTQEPGAMSAVGRRVLAGLCGERTGGLRSREACDAALGACAVGKLTTICSSIRSFVTTTYGV